MTAAPGVTTRVSVSGEGDEANEESHAPAISGDGRFVVFESEAFNLTSDDTDRFQDIFIRDRDSDEDGVFDEPGAVTTTRASVSSAGVAGDDFSSTPSISADGRLIAFESIASNLAAGDIPERLPDVFLHDRQTGTTTLGSVTSFGLPANFTSRAPAISADGRLLAFDSFAWNLVPGDTNNLRDVFVHDLLGTTVPCFGLPATIIGTPADDVLIGTAGPDVINALAGNDLVFGLGGNDVICGGDGGDALLGGTGRDLLLGGQGDDYMDGETGLDVCSGGPHIVGDLPANCEFLSEIP